MPLRHYLPDLPVILAGNRIQLRIAQGLDAPAAGRFKQERRQIRYKISFGGDPLRDFLIGQRYVDAQGAGFNKAQLIAGAASPDKMISLFKKRRLEEAGNLRQIPGRNSKIRPDVLLEFRHHSKAKEKRPCLRPRSSSLNSRKLAFTSFRCQRFSRPSLPGNVSTTLHTPGHRYRNL